MRSEGHKTRMLQNVSAKSCNMTPGREGWMQWRSRQQLGPSTSGAVTQSVELIYLMLLLYVSVRVNHLSPWRNAALDFGAASSRRGTSAGGEAPKKHPLPPLTHSPIPSDGVWSPTFILSTLIHPCHPHSCSPFMSNEKRSPSHDSARCRGLPDGHSGITSQRWIAVTLQLPLFRNDMSFSLWLSGWKRKINN